MKDIEIRVKKIVAEKLGIDVDSISNNKSLTDLGADNGQVSQLFQALENEFQMRIDTEIKTVQSAIEYAQKHSNIHII